MIKIIYFVYSTTTDNADKLCNGREVVNLSDWSKICAWQPWWEYTIE